jgi:hypothetical protein
MKKAIFLASLVLGFWLLSASDAQAAYSPIVGDLIRTNTNPTVYLVADDLVRIPLSAEAYAIRYGNNFFLVKYVDGAVIGNVPNHIALNAQTSKPNGTLIMYTTDKPTIYMVENGFKRPFASWDAFTSRGYSLYQVEWVGTYTTYATGQMIY